MKENTLMATAIAENTFVVWGADQTAYGPVELPTLVTWVKDERVTSDTWVFTVRNDTWQRAAQLPELQMFFGRSRNSQALQTLSPRGISPGALRRIKILALFSNEQLEQLAGFVEVEKVPQWTVVVRQGDPGASMYFILEGELRVRLIVLGKETILATLGPGDFFGDAALLDHGPRSADVIANQDSVVVRLSAAAFEQLTHEAPELAATFLQAMGKTLTARIRADNRRISDSVKLNLERE
jgi:hypothetical protein